MNRFRTTTVTSSIDARDFKVCRIVRGSRTGQILGGVDRGNYISVYVFLPVYRRESGRHRGGGGKYALLLAMRVEAVTGLATCLSGSCGKCLCADSARPLLLVDLPGMDCYVATYCCRSGGIAPVSCRAGACPDVNPGSGSDSGSATAIAGRPTAAPRITAAVTRRAAGCCCAGS